MNTHCVLLQDSEDLLLTYPRYTREEIEAAAVETGQSPRVWDLLGAAESEAVRIFEEELENRFGAAADAREEAATV